MDKHSTPTPVLRTIIIVAIVAILIYLIVIFIGPFITARLSSINNPTTRVSYEILGTSEKAVITYTKPDGIISKPTGVDLPWRSSIFTVKSGTLVILTAAGTEAGTIKCTIRSGNQIVDSNSNNPFADKAMCGGYVK